MPYPRLIPHSDGAGTVDEIGEGVSPNWNCQKVWCWGAQSYRPFGTAAEFTCVPADHLVPLPEGVSMEQGACLGIPGITAHRAVHIGGKVKARIVLVQGAAGAVGHCAVRLARLAGALVIGTVKLSCDEAPAREAGCHEVLVSGSEFAQRLKNLVPDGVDHIVEVAFAANIDLDAQLLKMDGSIATYATDHEDPAVPFWPLVSKNARIFFLGSDDFPLAAKMEAARDLNIALKGGWSGFEIAERFPLADIAHAHELVEHPHRRGRVVLTL